MEKKLYKSNQHKMIDGVNMGEPKLDCADIPVLVLLFCAVSVLFVPKLRQGTAGWYLVMIGLFFSVCADWRKDGWTSFLKNQGYDLIISNPRPPPWQGGAPPLSHSRILYRSKPVS